MGFEALGSVEKFGVLKFGVWEYWLDLKVCDEGPLISFILILGGSRDLVSEVISTLIGVISNYKCSYLIYNPSY